MSTCCDRNVYSYLMLLYLSYKLDTVALGHGLDHRLHQGAVVDGSCLFFQSSGSEVLDLCFRSDV